MEDNRENEKVIIGFGCCGEGHSFEDIADKLRELCEKENVEIITFCEGHSNEIIKEQLEVMNKIICFDSLDNIDEKKPYLEEYDSVKENVKVEDNRDYFRHYNPKRNPRKRQYWTI